MAKKEPWNPLLCNYPNSVKINRVSEGAETLYTRLLAKSDDRANFLGDPALVLCELCAKRWKNREVNKNKVAARLRELAREDLIVFYEVNDDRYLHILNCKKHLRKDYSRDYRFPEHPESLDTRTEPVTDTEREPNENRDAPTATATTTTTATAISSFSDLAKYHISVCPAPKATEEFEGQILEKFDDIEAVHGLKFTKALVMEFSHRSKRGDGMGLLSAAVKRGWMKSKLGERAFDKNLAVEKIAQDVMDKLPISQQSRILAERLKVTAEKTTEQKKQKMRKLLAADTGE